MRSSTAALLLVSLCLLHVGCGGKKTADPALAIKYDSAFRACNEGASHLRKQIAGQEDKDRIHFDILQIDGNLRALLESGAYLVAQSSQEVDLADALHPILEQAKPLAAEAARLVREKYAPMDIGIAEQCIEVFAEGEKILRTLRERDPRYLKSKFPELR